MYKPPPTPKTPHIKLSSHTQLYYLLLLGLLIRLLVPKTDQISQDKLCLTCLWFVSWETSSVLKADASVCVRSTAVLPEGLGDARAV